MLHVGDPVHASTPGEERTGDWEVSLGGWREEVSGWIKFVLWRTCTRTGDAVTNASGRRERHSAPVQFAAFLPLASPPSASASAQQVHAHRKACIYAAHVRTWAGTGNSVRPEARRLTSSSTRQKSVNVLKLQISARPFGESQGRLQRSLSCGRGSPARLHAASFPPDGAHIECMNK